MQIFMEFSYWYQCISQNWGHMVHMVRLGMPVVAPKDCAGYAHGIKFYDFPLYRAASCQENSLVGSDAENLPNILTILFSSYCIDTF